MSDGRDPRDVAPVLAAGLAGGRADGLAAAAAPVALAYATRCASARFHSVMISVPVLAGRRPWRSCLLSRRGAPDQAILILPPAEPVIPTISRDISLSFYLNSSKTFMPTAALSGLLSFLSVIGPLTPYPQVMPGGAESYLIR